VVVGGISYELTSDDHGSALATQLGKDFMHTAPFSCTAHSSLFKRAYGESLQLQV
jgi:hypothetical protein